MRSDASPLQQYYSKAANMKVISAYMSGSSDHLDF